MLIASGIAALVLAFIHLFASKMRFLQGIPRSRWLSMAGGASVAYVFIHLLPELQEWQHIFEEQGYEYWDFLSHHLYIISLFGLAIFYGLERRAKLSKESEREDSTEPKHKQNINVYYLHIISFAVYNALIGYLLFHRDVEGLTPLIMFTLAMGLHFIVNDYGLLDHYRDRYLKNGKWLLSGSIAIGWIVGALTEISETGIAIMFSFIAGGVILNVLKEELPEERKSRFWAFFLGMIAYTALLLIE